MSTLVATEVIEGGTGEPSVQSAHLSVPVGQVTLFGSDDPVVVIQRATAVAKSLMAVVEAQKLFANISRKRHLLVEAWTLLGSLVGVFPVPVWTRPIKDGDGRTIGWEARVEAHTIGGSVVGGAESMCMREESRWTTSEEHAIRSMAQTRATSKALATPLRFIAVLAGFAGTPAEELPAPQQKVTGHGLCPQCEIAKLSSRKGQPPRFIEHEGAIICNGVDSQGEPQRHHKVAEGDVDPDDVP